MNLSAIKLLPVILVMLIAPIGYLVGEGLSEWGARIHPVQEWRDWYAGRGTKYFVRKEICPDELGAIHLAGASPTNDIWNGSIGRNLKEIKSKGLYECRFRIRGNGHSPVCVLVIDHTKQRNLLEQLFTPPVEWHDYKFEFSIDDPTNLGISLYVGDRKIDVDVSKLTVSPLDLAKPSVPTECIDRPILNESWSMRPITKDGSTLLPAESSSNGGDFVFRMSPKGRDITSLVTQIVGLSNNGKLTFQLEASARPPSEVECWFQDANGNQSERQIIGLSEKIESQSIALSLAAPSEVVQVHLRPVSRCELCLHSSTLSTCARELLPKDLLDARLIRRVEDQGVSASIKRSARPEGPVSLVSTGDSVHVTRFDLPIAVEGGKQSRIVLNARADHPVNLRLVVAENHDPWNAISEAVDFPITEESKELEIPFHPKVNDSNARLVLSWSDSNATVEVSNIRLISDNRDDKDQGSNR